MAPLISVIVPVYNVAPYLSSCLDSILAQTLHDIEVICVDDASTDGSNQILREAASRDPRIRVIRNAVNSGLSTTRNVGIDAARGEWLCFVDSDDLVDASLCERALLTAHETGADAVFFDFQVFKDGSIPNSTPAPSILDVGRATDCHYLLGLGAFAWTKLVRRDHWLRKGFRFPDGLSFEDTLVHWRLILETPRIAILPERRYFYRQRAGSICYRRDWSRADSIQVHDLTREFLRNAGFYAQYEEDFAVREMVNLAQLYNYYEIANIEHLPAVRAAALSRMTPTHWRLVGCESLPSWRYRCFFDALRGHWFAAICLICTGFLRRAAHFVRRFSF